MEKLLNYIKETYDHDELENIVDNGCVNGAAGCHIYYVDTIKFYEEFEEQIWELINNYADDQGISCLQFIDSLNSNVICDAYFKNLLCWFAIEDIALKLTEGEII